MGEVTQRQISGVDDVHVEVHDHRPAARQRCEHFACCRLRVGDQLRAFGMAHALVREELAAQVSLLARVATDYRQPTRLQ